MASDDIFLGNRAGNVRNGPYRKPHGLTKVIPGGQKNKEQTILLLYEEVVVRSGKEGARDGSWEWLGPQIGLKSGFVGVLQ